MRVIMIGNQQDKQYVRFICISYKLKINTPEIVEFKMFSDLLIKVDLYDLDHNVQLSVYDNFIVTYDMSFSL